MQYLVYGFRNPDPINFLGEFTTTIERNGQVVETEIAVVVGGEKNLIGYKTASKLGVVKIINNIDQTECKKLDFYFKKYPECFCGIRLTHDKIKALVEATTPSNASEVHSLLGLSTYASRFVKKHADIVEPLRKLIRKNTRWSWGPSEDEALRKLKDAVAEHVSL